MRIGSILVRAAAALAALAALGAGGCSEISCYFQAKLPRHATRSSPTERREMRRELKTAGVLADDALAKLDRADETE